MKTIRVSCEEIYGRFAHNLDSLIESYRGVPSVWDSEIASTWLEQNSFETVYASYKCRRQKEPFGNYLDRLLSQTWKECAKTTTDDCETFDSGDYDPGADEDD